MSPLNKETIDGILELTGGDESILIELFESFLDDAKELSGGIKTGADTSDWEKLKFDVHTLKGLCGTIGANPLFEICKVLNDDVKDGKYETLIPLANEVIEKYKDLVVYITSNYDIKYEA
jgi:HPt (histidine-containing phosphotransfer) domain-containing protein